VTLGDQVTVLHHVCIRGDVAPIILGDRVNVQDGTVIHTRTGVPNEIAEDVSIGHRAVVHGRRIAPRTLIGIGAIVLDESEIGSECIIAAGAVVLPGTKIPDGKVVAGVPGKILREITDEDRRYIQFVTDRYLELGPAHAAGRFPPLQR
jgi:carbonic anhydrase/acetyltransferase-like protein (isoleucine patch superfamily)